MSFTSPVYAGMFGYAMQSLTLGYLTVKWYTPIIISFLFAPIHYMILRYYGILDTLTLNIFYYILYTMIGILLAGLISYAAMAFGYDCEPLLPLPGFGDKFKSPTIMVINLIACMLLDLLWLGFYYHDRLYNYNWAIIGAWLIKNGIIFVQYLVTYSTTKHQENIGALEDRTPFKSLGNVNAVFLLYAILINVPFIALISAVNLYPASSFSEVWGTFIGLSLDMLIVIVWIIKTNMNQKKI